MARSIQPTNDDITIFLRAKLRKDTMPDAMDENLGEEIIQRGIWGGWVDAVRVVGALFGGRLVNPDTPDTIFDRTRLSWAADNGHD